MQSIFLNKQSIVMKQKPNYRFFKTCLLTLLIAAGLNSAIAQTRVITGKVTGANGAGIQGVSVIEKGTNIATSTDNSGKYLLKTSTANPVLLFSFVGYTSREMPVGTGNNLDVQIEQNAAQLNEIVVTALGIKKETRKVGYAVQEVKGSDLTVARDVNPVQGLIGKVSGLSIGASAEMLMRPQVVLRGSTDVLYVIDGVPINSDTWNIAPDDIETYSVLKGPNAAALYGFRGLNGAIIMTTKRGSTGTGFARKGWQVTFNNSTMFENGFLTEPKSQTEYGRGTGFLYQYAKKGYTYGTGDKSVDVLYDNAQRLQEYGPRFEGQMIKQFDGPYDPVTGVRTSTPWLARGANNFHNFMETGILNTTNVAASASGSNYDIRISYSHIYQKGMAPNTQLNIDNVGLNTGYDISPRLRVEGNINLNIQYSPNIPDVSYGPNSYTYMFKVYGSSDYDINSLKNIYQGPQGVQDLTQYAPEYGRENSAWFMAKEWLRTHNKTDIYAYLRLRYKVSNDISIAFRSAVTTWDQLRAEKVPPSANLNTYLSWYYFGWYGDYREDHRNLLENNTDILATYTKKVSDWNINLSLGGSMRAFKYSSTWGTTKDMAVPKLYILSNSINPVLNYSFGSRMQVYSGYYSLDFGYKNYFTISTTGRVDNLSTLPTGYNTFFYPSVSVSTPLTDYMNLPAVISFLKLRASYANVKGGLTSSSIGTAYSSVTGSSVGNLLGYGTEDVTSYDGPSYLNQNAYSIVSYYNGQTAVNYSNTLANPTLKPYSVTSYEAGADIYFLRNRLGLNVTYFSTVNGPNIYALPLASSTSYYAHNVNGITTLKQGWEVTLSGSPIKSSNGFTWDILINWATYKETLKEIYGGETELALNGHNYKIGERLDAYYSTKFVRDGSGNIIYAGGLPVQAPAQADNSNRGFIGYLNPDYIFGINNRFTYKNFSLSFQFDGRIGGKIYDRVYYQGNNGGTSIESASGDYGKARLLEWQSTNQGMVAPTPAYVAKGSTIVSGTPVYVNGQISNLKDLVFAPNTTAVTVQNFLSSGIGGNFDEYYMIDRSFVKLREVDITYHIPIKHSKVFTAASVSLIGRNLLYFAKRTDFDIDQYAAGFNSVDKSAGGSYIDLQSSTARRYGFNISLSF
jgi:TonB-linked SusC/RagA family outer membrane protein